MQNENKETFKQKILIAPTVLSIIAILIQCAMSARPYVTATYFHNTSIQDMWSMFIALSDETKYFTEMLTFLILFEITAFVPPVIITKMPRFSIVLAIANILMVKTVPFFWDGVFPTTGLEATTGYYGFLIANIIIIIGACIAYKKHAASDVISQQNNNPNIAFDTSKTRHHFTEKTCDNENNTRHILNTVSTFTKKQINDSENDTAKSNAEVKTTVTHKWRCDSCRNMRTQSPCEHCGQK